MIRSCALGTSRLGSFSSANTTLDFAMLLLKRKNVKLYVDFYIDHHGLLNCPVDRTGERIICVVDHWHWREKLRPTIRQIKSYLRKDDCWTRVGSGKT